MNAVSDRVYKKTASCGAVFFYRVLINKFMSSIGENPFEKGFFPKPLS